MVNYLKFDPSKLILEEEHDYYFIGYNYGTVDHPIIKVFNVSGLTLKTLKGVNKNERVTVNAYMDKEYIKFWNILNFGIYYMRLCRNFIKRKVVN